MYQVRSRMERWTFVQVFNDEGTSARVRYIQGGFRGLVRSLVQFEKLPVRTIYTTALTPLHSKNVLVHWA